MRKLKKKINISSHSNSPSNLSLSPFNCSYVSINSTKSLGDSQPTLASLGQFLLSKINFSKFSFHKWHLLRLVNMLAKEKILLVFICDPTILTICWTRKPIVGNMNSSFYHHWKRHLISKGSTWNLLKINSSMLTSSLTRSLVLAIISKISKIQSSSTLWFKQFIIRCKWW
jgi:hypothetical protein